MTAQGFFQVFVDPVQAVRHLDDHSRHGQMNRIGFLSDLGEVADRLVLVLVLAVNHKAHPHPAPACGRTTPRPAATYVSSTSRWLPLATAVSASRIDPIASRHRDGCW